MSNQEGVQSPLMPIQISNQQCDIKKITFEKDLNQQIVAHETDIQIEFDEQQPSGIEIPSFIQEPLKQETQN